MFHFLIGLALGVLAAILTHRIMDSDVWTAVAGVSAALLYWLIVGIRKGYIRDIDFPDIPGLD